MNTYFRSLKKALLTCLVPKDSDYLYMELTETIGDTTISHGATYLYIGEKTSTKTPQKIDNNPVSIIGPFTFSGNTDVENVIVTSNITEIM